MHRPVTDEQGALCRCQTGSGLDTGSASDADAMGLVPVFRC